MSTPTSMSQKAYREHATFCEANPAWASRAVAATNRWGAGEVTLVVAIAEALMQAYADGKAGVKIEKPAPTLSTVIRRRTR